MSYDTSPYLDEVVGHVFSEKDNAWYHEKEGSVGQGLLGLVIILMAVGLITFVVLHVVSQYDINIVELVQSFIQSLLQ